MTSDYCTYEDILTYVGETVNATTFDQAKVKAIIPGISGFITSYCRRSFDLRTDATIMVDWTSSSKIRVPEDLWSLSEIETTGGQIYDNTDCVLVPVTRPPYRWILMNSGKYLTYDESPSGAILLTGDFGYGLVPAEIKLACMIMVVDEYHRAQMGAYQSVNAGGVSASMKAEGELSPRVKQLLSGRRKTVVET